MHLRGDTAPANYWMDPVVKNKYDKTGINLSIIFYSDTRFILQVI